MNICYCGNDRDDDDHRLPATRGEMHDLMNATNEVLHRLNGIGDLLMTINDDQAHLDADVKAETGLLTELEAVLANLKAQPPAVALNFTEADAFLARLKADATPPAPPAPPVPAPTPDPVPTPAPVVDPVPPVAVDPNPPVADPAPGTTPPGGFVATPPPN